MRKQYRHTKKDYVSLNLQLFDDTVVMNATTSNTTGNDLSSELRTFYVRTLLKNAKELLVHDQFAQKVPIPKNGGQTVNFRRFDKLKPNLTPLEEGVTPAGSKLNAKKIEVTLKQYGAYYLLTDWLVLTSPDPILTVVTENLGDNAGETLDMITREKMMTGTNVCYGDGTITSRDKITTDMLPTMEMFKNGRRILTRVNAKTFENGTYISIIHPDTWFDLATELENIYKYTESGMKRLYKGEIGTYFGVRFIEAAKAKIFPSAGAVIKDTEKVDVYASMMIGKDAYGTTSIEGEGMEMIAKQRGSSGTADPLNQRSTAGWKANKAVVILSEENMLRIEHATSTNLHEAN